MKLVYSQEAVSDLIRLRDYICSFPNMGKAVALSPEPLDIRDSIFGKYVVRYVAQAESIIILRVWHHYESR